MVDTRFKKGIIPWNTGLTKETDQRLAKLSEKNKGKVMSKESNEKNRLSKLGKHYSPNTEFKKGLVPWCTGTKGLLKGWNKGLTKETDERVLKSSISNKNSEKRKGKHYSPETEFKKGMITWNVGKHHKEESNEKNRQKHLGKKHTKEWIEKRANQIMPFKDTSIEVKIQNLLKELKIGFFTHYYCKEIEHSYQCDIFIPVQRNRERFIKQPIIIECDGDFIHCNPRFYPEDFVRFPNSNDKRTTKYIWERDRIRTEELTAKGFKVIRLWGHEIKIMNLNKFKEILQEK